MPRRLDISLVRTPVMWAHRLTLGPLKLVYIITTDKLLSYKKGRSRIAYIGTTKNGTTRFSQSVAFRAEAILMKRGVCEMHVRTVTCRPRQNVHTWKLLERALLLAFKDAYGEVPICNVHGKGYVWDDELDYFTRKRLETILDEVR